METDSTRYLLFHEVDFLEKSECYPIGFQMKKNKYVLDKETYSSVLRHEDPNKVVLTFDDAGYSQYDAIKLANLHGFKTILFVPIAFINQPTFMTFEQIIDLSKNNLNIIGVHGFNHRMDSLNSHDAKREVNLLMDASLKYDFINFHHLALPGGTFNMNFMRLYNEAFQQRVNFYHSGSLNSIVNWIAPEWMFKSRWQVIDEGYSRYNIKLIYRELKTIIRQIYYGKFRTNV